MKLLLLLLLCLAPAGADPVESLMALARRNPYIQARHYDVLQRGLQAQSKPERELTRLSLLSLNQLAAGGKTPAAHLRTQLAASAAAAHGDGRQFARNLYLLTASFHHQNEPGVQMVENGIFGEKHDRCLPGRVLEYALETWMAERMRRADVRAANAGFNEEVIDYQTPGTVSHHLAFMLVTGCYYGRMVGRLASDEADSPRAAQPNKADIRVGYLGVMVGGLLGEKRVRLPEAAAILEFGLFDPRASRQGAFPPPGELGQFDRYFPADGKRWLAFLRK